jgi:prepilin-type processing-associated H-X9-DG protein
LSSFPGDAAVPISFSCPYCGNRTLVADQYLGQSGPCGGCGKIITVPAAGAPGAAPVKPKGGGVAIAIVAVSIVVMLVLLLVCGGAFASFFSRGAMFSRGSAAATRSPCSNNLKQIVLALHNYHDVHGRFPPAVITDKSGKPMHSWRVAILPFLEQQSLYSQYNLKEPWDSPQNQRVAATIVSAYSCPDDDGPPTDTSYVMITGPNTLGGKPNEAVRFSDITDGASNTIAVVEMSTSGIGWSEPRDLSIEELSFQINGPRGKCISSNHRNGANAAMADGSIRFLPGDLDAETLRRLLIRNDGKPVEQY